MDKETRGTLEALAADIYGETAGAETATALCDLIEARRSKIGRWNLLDPAHAAEDGAHGDETGSAGGGHDADEADEGEPYEHGEASGGRTDATVGPGAARSEVRRGLPLSEEDSFVITYGDQFRGGERPLVHLGRFLEEEVEGAIRGVHILPFAPYSSDDGFSVIDYETVDPALGSWADIESVAKRFRLMVDLVLNHCSRKHEWFRRFLEWEAPYRDYFIVVPEGTDTSSVVRPRALPLLTRFQTTDGPKLVWTTFSDDQVDLNYANPRVLVEMVGVLLEYLAHGAQVIRLDAIAYLWKELGTPCIHHPTTHAVVRLIRLIMQEVAPWSVLITETNVPHEENVSYFGTAGDEAHMVYQFALPPLVLDAFLRQDASKLVELLRRLPADEAGHTYFNFLASHDGVGVLPARGFLSEDEFSALLESVTRRGGRISYKATNEGDVPYELNINYFDAVAEAALPDVQRVRKFLASQAVMLSFPGVPGIYIHSLIGSGNWSEGVELTGHNRSINRQKLEAAEVEDELNRKGSVRRLVFDGYRAMLRARGGNDAFHPAGLRRVLESPRRILALVRTSPDGTTRVLCLTSVSHEPCECGISEDDIDFPEDGVFRDLITGDYVFPHREGKRRVSFELDPHEVLWLAY